MFRAIIRAGLVYLGLHVCPALAIELGAMEVRSEVGMPLIAHVQFEMSAQESRQPEQINIVVRSTSVADFKGLVRTRVFLQPNSSSGFLRITAIEAAPRGLALVLEAHDPRQNHVREYVIDNNVVRTRDFQTPELPKPVSAPPPPPADLNVEPKKMLEPAPPDGIELRLLDQTKGEEVVSPRALASDLALLNKTQAALLNDEQARLLAADALATLGGLAQKSRGLFDIKASREVVLAAMEDEVKVEPDSYVLTIQGDQLNDDNSSPMVPATLGKSGDIELPAPESQSKAIHLEATASPPTESKAHPQHENALQATAAPHHGRGWEALIWMLLSVVSIALGLLFWFTTRARQEAQQEQVATTDHGAVPEELSSMPTEGQTGQLAADEPLALPEPEPQDSHVNDDWLSGQDEPDFELAATPDIPSVQMSEAALEKSPVVDKAVAQNQLADLEPPFKNENDARIELAGAYLEIEDFEAATKMLGGIEGELTLTQQQRLEQIREEIMQGEARS